MIRGHNGDPAYNHAGDMAIEFFSKAGSLMEKGKKGKGKTKSKGRGDAYYGNANEATALALFQPVWMMPGLENKATALKLLFWLRDPRGGAGNRSGFRTCLRWLAAQPEAAMDPVGDGAAWLAVNMMRIPEWGRWDDLSELFGTSLNDMAGAVWAEAIMRQDHLACKWAKVDMRPLQKQLHVNEHGLRKLVVPHRATVVERAMCEKNWAAIDYSKIPSKAMSLYVKAFKKRDTARFEAYKAALVRGDKGVKINADVLFPHDVYKQAVTGDATIANAQFAALPNYMAESNRKIMALIDTSGSMTSSSGVDGVSNRDIAIALALYVTDRLGKTNPFYRRYMEFASSPDWVDWRNQSYDRACRNHKGNCGSTNVEAALDSILKGAVAVRLPPQEMITHLLIVSDMQFDSSSCCTNNSSTVVEQCMRKWEIAGYARPTIVFWNLAGYGGQQATADTPNTALVSGFSAAILKSILSGKTVSPREVMLRALEKYQIEVPVVG